jgi:hypothetical protein
MSRRPRAETPDKPAPSRWVPGGWIWSPEAGDWIAASPAPLSLPAAQPEPTTTTTPEEATDEAV